MFYFCTYFDSHYLIKGLALYRSLVRHAKPFRLWVLCFDDLTYKILQKLALPDVVPISLGDFERGDEELVQVKGNRSQIEYYFTCTPSLPLYILRNYPEVDVITYLDADLFFFSDPSPIYQELGDNSVLIIEHRFPPHLKHKEVYGIYNVGFLSFRRDDIGSQCLHWWRDRCLQWCYDRVENSRFADQKYLNDWPSLFRGVVILQHKGAGLAPWNVKNYSICLEKGQVMVNSQPLVFFHFQGLKQIKRWLYEPNLLTYGVHADSLLKQYIYGPYIQEMQEIACWLSVCVGRTFVHMGSIRGGGTEPIRSKSGNVFRRIERKIKHQLLMIKKILQGYLLVVIGRRVM